MPRKGLRLAKPPLRPSPFSALSALSVISNPRRKREKKEEKKKQQQKHTIVGIPTWSPTAVLINRSKA